MPASCATRFGACAAGSGLHRVKWNFRGAPTRLRAYGPTTQPALSQASLHCCGG